ncbi:helix-turn-helix domain-containing protein [Chitinimonas lacunae]|uniref:Helix-turn-helix domain-containing protein n=1 Tax=Chitinimonas lacunae TaxID=1963018 RepID=A0ABV8MY19_9NEIS
MRTKHYEHLQPEERITLASLRQQGHSIRAIARALGRSPSALSRELCRNALDGQYVAQQAQQRMSQRRIDARPWPKLHPERGLWLIVCTCLGWYWGQLTKRKKSYAKPRLVFVAAGICLAQPACSAARCSRRSG